jgi:hypothetical protein
MKTATSFPVVPGTAVKIECSDFEAINGGSSEVTCSSGSNFNYEKEPYCLGKTGKQFK